MIDRTQAGARCYALRLICTVKGDVARGSYGTVLYAMENLGRRLMLVQWDTGMTVPIFPDEIVVEGQLSSLSAE